MSVEIRGLEVQVVVTLQVWEEEVDLIDLILGTLSINSLMYVYQLDSGAPCINLYIFFEKYLKQQVPPEVLEAARKLGQEALSKRLKEIQMSENEFELYSSISLRIQDDVMKLRGILEGARSKEKERVWMKNRTEGEMDDSKVVEGIFKFM
jgi:hypothetical protein